MRMVFDGEDTADYSEDSESESVSMVTKVIATLVALLIVVVLAFPVANSLTASDDTEDNNGEPIEYTNTGDYYYKSAEGVSTAIWIVTNSSTVTVLDGVVEDYDQSTVLFTCPYNASAIPVVCLAFGPHYEIWLMSDGCLCHAVNPWFVQYYYAVIHDGLWDMHSLGAYPIDYLLSSETEGSYVYSTNSPIVSNSDTIYVAYMKDNVVLGPNTTLVGKGTPLTIQMNLDARNLNSASQPVSFDIRVSDIHSDYTVLKNMTVKVDSEDLDKPVTIPVTGFFVPVSVTYTPDVEDGLSGVAKVLVLLVPTLLVLGVLLIFVMPMLKRDEEII